MSLIDDALEKLEKERKKGSTRPPIFSYLPQEKGTTQKGRAWLHHYLIPGGVIIIALSALTYVLLTLHPSLGENPQQPGRVPAVTPPRHTRAEKGSGQARPEQEDKEEAEKGEDLPDFVQQVIEEARREKEPPAPVTDSPQVPPVLEKTQSRVRLKEVAKDRMALNYFWVAKRHQDRGEIDQAIQMYRKALERDPDMLAAQNNLGVLLLQKKDYDQALKQFQEILATHPENVSAWVNSGLAYLELEDYTRAQEAFLKALSLEPENIQAHLNLGVIYSHMGRLREAQAEFQQILSREPNNYKALLNLALAYEKEGQLEASISCYERYLQVTAHLSPPPSSFQLVMEHLGQLRLKKGLRK